MLCHIKRKASLPPSNSNNSNCDHKAKPSPEPSDRTTQNGKKTRKFGIITRTPGSKESKERLSSEHGNGHCTRMEVEISQPETSKSESSGEEQLCGTGEQYQSWLSDGSMPDIGDQSTQGHDLITITETWWDSSHDWTAVMDGYVLFRKDRPARPPYQEEEVDEAFYRQLEVASRSQALVLMGDFNHPDICWKGNAARHTQSRRFLQNINDNFLTQVVEEPTRRGVLLDLVLTNKEGTG
ncbi:PDZ domain-containing protein 2 [Grus japonensis]|uniref:PDZ domain-containing protein 2 n=1 Tax=Grus japonensis TaxID=30415 RepID=A0ABC9YFM6_GRUJA